LVAEAITTSGQLSIRWIERAVNKYLNDYHKTSGHDYVIASDTDSIYVCFDKLVSKFYDERTETQTIVKFLDDSARTQIEPFIKKSYQSLHEYVNSSEQKMEMSREVIADKGIWTAKKRYILNVWDNEGVQYKEAQLKIMGIEAVKSSTPSACRSKIKEALKIIMNGTEKEMNTFIQQFREEFMNLPIEEIAYPRSVNGVDKFADNKESRNRIQKKLVDRENKKSIKKIQKLGTLDGTEVTYGLFSSGAPIAVKGAILYNHLLEKHKLNHKWPYIQGGDKIKFVHLREPNIYQSSAFSFITSFPKELDVYNLIDKEEQFEKSFIQPISFILAKINWLIDKSYGTQGSLEDFFN